MQTHPAVEQNKNTKWSESPWNQSGSKGKGLWRKGFAEEPSDAKLKCFGKFNNYHISRHPELVMLVTRMNDAAGSHG